MGGRARRNGYHLRIAEVPSTPNDGGGTAEEARSGGGITTRSRVANALDRIGLARPAYRLLEWTRTLEALPELISNPRGADPAGLPLPPPSLRTKVTHTARASEFLVQGQRAASTVREVVQRSGRELDDLSAVLDFGCGCGRVIRHWADVAGPAIFGCDYNPHFIKWCSGNLRFATFRINLLTPPLPFDDAQFELVYALSVFTHLTEPVQHAWIDELARVVKPGGLLLLTTRGDAWIKKLSSAERARYEAGELVTRYASVEGTNLCATWHPWSYIQRRMTTSFAVLESLQAALADGYQDVHLLERRQ